MMKFSVLFAGLCLALLAGVATANSIAEHHDHFLQWKAKHGRTYSVDSEEHAKRFAIFMDNKEHVAVLNEKNMGAVFTIEGPFADMTQDEFKAKMRTLQVDEAARAQQQAGFPQWVVKDLPASFDWRDKGAVTPVKNQGQCGSCWAFSTVGALEGSYFLKTGTLKSFSEQELVDCSHDCIEFHNQQGCNAGCNGGLQPAAFKYLMEHGAEEESSYPYTARAGQCSYDESKGVVKVQNYTMIAQDADQVKAALVNYGPLAIAVNAEPFQFYHSGILSSSCPDQLDHGVTLVGYGSGKHWMKTEEYWLIKNSWGETWGEQGYIRVAIKGNLCGVTDYVSRPEL